jgi:RNA polymerase sigma factor (sigma-70 family)
LKNHEIDINTLLDLCIKKNEKAQFTVYNKYYKAMFNVAFRIVNNHDLAEDIMQESFLKAFDKLETYNREVAFGAWLKRIVINNSINEFNKSNKHKIETLQDNVVIIDSQDDDHVSYNDLKAEVVLKTMQSLKPNYKVILTLFFIEGYDMEEIMQILNISYENCRTMMSRAKESLRTKLIAG